MKMNPKTQLLRRPGRIRSRNKEKALPDNGRENKAIDSINANAA